MAFDAEGDSKPGITVIPRSGSDYSSPPTSVLLIHHADPLYTITRSQYVATVPDPNCANSLEGTAEPKAADTLIVDCHIQDGSDCTVDNADFINQQRPKQIPGPSTWTAKVIPGDTSCEQI